MLAAFAPGGLVRFGLDSLVHQRTLATFLLALLLVPSGAGAQDLRRPEEQLAAIYAPRQRAGSLPIADVQLELLTEGGSRILWGRAPGSIHPGELEPTQKIGRLKLA